MSSSEAAGSGEVEVVSGASDLARLLRAICETPAPTFAEEARAQLLLELLSQAGLEAGRDRIGNVIATLPGGSGPRVLLAAHLDTVFSQGTDVSVKVDGDRWSAPGVGDNSASLALLVHLLARLARGGGGELPRITVAATVGEEGLGDLRGIRRLLEDDDDFGYVVAVDGHLGTVVDTGVGSRRFELEVNAAGGHSWGDFPGPSAVHAAASMIHALQEMAVPSQPRSSFNVGQVWGGTGINAIAEGAGFNLDLRSVDPATLDRLERDALARMRRVARNQRVRLAVRKVGDRPAARASGNRQLAQAALSALAEAGAEGRLTGSSTDANVAMAAGIPAIAFGVYRGGDAHRMSEWLDFPSLEVGEQALLGLLTRIVRLGAPGAEERAG